jgi:hypothetical protein
MMKAYRAFLAEETWMMLVHGNKREQAKWNFVKWNPESADNSFYPDIRLRRLPEWDDKPFTDCEDIRALFYTDEYDEKGDPLFDRFVNDCHCELCQKGR